MANELCNLGVTSCDLLEDGLKHLGLLLNKLAQLLEMGVAPKKFEIRECFSTCGSSTGTGTGTGSTSTTGGSARTPTFITCLRSGFEQVDRFIFATSSGGRRGGSRGFAGSGVLGSGGSLGLLLFLLNVFRDTLRHER